MNKIYLDIEGINKNQAHELISQFNSIENVKAIVVEPQFEYKSLEIPILLELGKGVLIAIIAGIILKFFQKEKSNDGNPIIINYKNTININQIDSKEEIERKVKEIIEPQTEKK